MSNASSSYLYEHVDWPPLNSDGENPLWWDGTVSDALHELGGMVDGDPHNKNIIWHPSRVMAAVIGSATPEGQSRIGLINAITAFTLELYTGNATPADVENVTARIGRLGLGGLDAHQWIDNPTFVATNPNNARGAAERLDGIAHSRSVLMLPICNGGFAASIMAALEYQRRTGRTPAIYPIRFSHNKKWDTRPRTTPVEITHIGEGAVDNLVVVSDDDASSGKSMGEVVSYVRSLLPNNYCIGLVSSDRRSEELREAQGEWWENYTPYYSR